MVILPTYSDPFYSVTVTLENRPYQFDFRYAEREDRWYFSLSDIDTETAIVDGVKVVPGFDLLGPYRYFTNCPQGYLAAVSNNSDDSPPGLKDLASGGRVSLVYLTQNEVLTKTVAPLTSVV